MRTLIQALKTKELRKKILFVLFIIIVYRIGSFIPTPGVDYNVVNKCMATIGSASQENFIGLVNLFSGGAMLQLSIFALGVMPYITASIVVQLLRVVIPRFEALHKEGQSGEAKLTQYTRYLTIGLAVLQSTTILVTARSGALFNYQCDQVIPDGSVFNLVVMVLIMTGGTGLIMWMAELVTDKGIGQGMSILIFMSICSGFLPQSRTDHDRCCFMYRCGNVCFLLPRHIFRPAGNNSFRQFYTDDLCIFLRCHNMHQSTPHTIGCLTGKITGSAHILGSGNDNNTSITSFV